MDSTVTEVSNSDIKVIDWTADNCSMNVLKEIDLINEEAKVMDDLVPAPALFLTRTRNDVYALFCINSDFSKFPNILALFYSRYPDDLKTYMYDRVQELKISQKQKSLLLRDLSNQLETAIISYHKKQGAYRTR